MTNKTNNFPWYPEDEVRRDKNKDLSVASDMQICEHKLRPS